MKSSKQTDIIHAHWLLSGFFGVITAFIYSKPIIVTIRGSDLNMAIKNKFSLMIARFVMNNATILTAVSEDLKNKISKITNNKVLMIPNGIDRNLFYPQDKYSCKEKLKLKTAKKYILYAGAVRTEKGIYDLLEAYKLANLKNVDLLIIGNGNKREIIRLNKTIKGIISDTNNIHHYTDISHGDIPTWINACDLVILPSYNEGRPNIIIESMACGIPIIATRVGGIPELIIDSFNGYLIDKKDSIQLSEKIKICMKNDRLLEKFSYNTKNHINDLQLDWKNNSKRFNDLYNSLGS